MAAGDIKLVYGSASDVSITLAALATDTNKLTGRESAAIDNSAAGNLDILVSGKITTGTTPTASKSIEVWAVASWDGTNWPDVFDGTDSAETITSAEIKNALCALVASFSTTSTSDRPYAFAGKSIASLFGGVLPPKFVLFVTHDTGVNLNATAGNHQIRLQPVYQNAAAS